MRTDPSQIRHARPLLLFGVLFLLLCMPFSSIAQGEGSEASKGDSISHELGASFLIFPDWREDVFTLQGNELGYIPFYRFWYGRWGVQIGFKPFMEDLNDGRKGSYGAMLDLHFRITRGNTVDLLAYQGNSFLYNRKEVYCFRVGCHGTEFEEELLRHHRLGLGMDVTLIDRFGMTVIGSVSSDGEMNEFRPMGKGSFYYRF